MKEQSLKDLAALVGRILAQRWHDHLQEEKRAAAGIESNEKPPSSEAPADASLATGPWPNAASSPWRLRRTSSPTPCG